jgi:hypothetical protein
MRAGACSDGFERQRVRLAVRALHPAGYSSRRARAVSQRGARPPQTPASQKPPHRPNPKRSRPSDGLNWPNPPKNQRHATAQAKTVD